MLSPAKRKVLDDDAQRTMGMRHDKDRLVSEEFGRIVSLPALPAIQLLRDCYATFQRRRSVPLSERFVQVMCWGSTRRVLCHPAYRPDAWRNAGGLFEAGREKAFQIFTEFWGMTFASFRGRNVRSDRRQDRVVRLGLVRSMNGLGFDGSRWFRRCRTNMAGRDRLIVVIFTSGARFEPFGGLLIQ